MELLLIDNEINEQVKVVVRIRPFNNTEKEHGEVSVVAIDSERNEVILKQIKNRISHHSSPETSLRHHTFDAVLSESMTQSEIYTKVFHSLVDSTVNGFNGTVFAYGQTGTGKTYTMEGSLESKDKYGVIPNAFQQIFDQVSANREKRYLIGASYFEIYQEEIRDLLAAEKLKKCTIHEGPNGIHIKGLSSYLCSSIQEITDLMVKGKMRRAVGSTNMNEHSSRSHAVFQITIETSDKSDIDGDHIKVGKLNLVDLAGSERVSKTGAEGIRLKEASKINLSLSTLGNVISALVDRADFVPYRESKLTRILQDSLGGNSHTVMIATIGPAGCNYEETMNTLRYASRAKNIQNKPRINENPKDAVLRKYQEEINRLRKKIEEKKAKQQSEGMQNNIDYLTKSAGSEITNDSGTSANQKEVMDMMGSGKIKELTDILSPLGIMFEGNIEDIKGKLKERTEMLEKDTQMLKEDKLKLSADLQKASQELISAEFECSRLLKQIKWLESKVLNSSGENFLLKKMRSQKEEIELKEIELEIHKVRHEQLRKALKEKQLTNEEAQATFETVENELNSNIKKIGKISKRISNFVSDKKNLEIKHYSDMKKLKECSVEMTKELKLKKTIVDNLIPRKMRKVIEERMRYDEESDTYFVELPDIVPVQPPKINRMILYPLINLTRYNTALKPIEKIFYTNENLALIQPDTPCWLAKDSVREDKNPKLDSLVKSAMKDIGKAVIIDCDHKTDKLRPTRTEAPTYVALGPATLLRNIRSEAFIDFSLVPSDIDLPAGLNIQTFPIPKMRRNANNLTQEQIFALPLIKYIGRGELSFEEKGPPNQEENRAANLVKSSCSKHHNLRDNTDNFKSRGADDSFQEMEWTPKTEILCRDKIVNIETNHVSRKTEKTPVPSSASKYSIILNDTVLSNNNTVIMPKDKSVTCNLKDDSKKKQYYCSRSESKLNIPMTPFKTQNGLDFSPSPSYHCHRTLSPRLKIKEESSFPQRKHPSLNSTPNTPEDITDNLASTFLSKDALKSDKVSASIISPFPIATPRPPSRPSSQRMKRDSD